MHLQKSDLTRDDKWQYKPDIIDTGGTFEGI